LTYRHDVLPSSGARAAAAAGSPRDGHRATDIGEQRAVWCCTAIAIATDRPTDGLHFTECGYCWRRRYRHHCTRPGSYVVCHAAISRSLYSKLNSNGNGNGVNTTERQHSSGNNCRTTDPPTFYPYKAIL